jgi:flagellar M-ring protein FliF
MQLASKGQGAQWQPRSADEIRNLTTLAQAAVGYDPARGDMLTVEDLSFAENRTQQPLTMQAELLAKLEDSPVLVKYAALLFAVIVVVLFGVRPAIRRAKPVPILASKETKAVGKGALKELPGQTAALPQPALKPPDPVELDPERIRAQEIYEQVTGHLKREPSQSSRLLQSWIHSD